jgi:hypothetical protein
VRNSAGKRGHEMMRRTFSAFNSVDGVQVFQKNQCFAFSSSAQDLQRRSAVRLRFCDVE